MDWLHVVFDFFRHFDEHLSNLSYKYGAMMYAIMFVIIFCETGLVVTPFLPGDSMIFAAAALSAQPNNLLNVHLIAALLIVAAFSGDVVNYLTGKLVGKKVYNKNYRRINRGHLEQSGAFFKKYGVRTVIYARFIPVIRTFIPFLAGVGKMDYRRFMQFNFAGAFIWVSLYAYAGYFFGNVPFVKRHFELMVLAILVLTLIPAIYAVAKAIVKSKKSKKRRRKQG